MSAVVKLTVIPDNISYLPLSTPVKPKSQVVNPEQGLIIASSHVTKEVSESPLVVVPVLLTSNQRTKPSVTTLKLEAFFIPVA